MHQDHGRKSLNYSKTIGTMVSIHKQKNHHSLIKKKKLTINIYTMIFNKFIIISYQKKKKKLKHQKFLKKKFITLKKKKKKNIKKK